jgi:ABC-type nitrate/sulfonate/bicarbonate transport system substrate-binding protein
MPETRDKPLEDKTKMTLPKSTLAIFWFAFLFSVGSIPAPAKGEEVTLSYTASTLTFLAAKIALDQNFFRQEGLDVKFIQMRTAANIPALANGHIDYTMSFLPPIDSALRGVPIQMTAVFVDRSLHYLVTRPNIKSSADVRGKTFVLNTVDLNGSTGLVFQAVLRHFGFDPLKDVKWISAADSPALFAMVEQGIADATFLVPPWPHKARTAGLNVLFRAGDVYSAPLAGLSTYRRTLKEKPDQVRRMLRALVRATRFILQPGNQQSVAGTVQQWLKMPIDEGAQALKDVMFAYSDGLPRNEKSFWDVVGTRAKLTSSSVPLSEVADFSLVKGIRTK